MAGIGNDNDVEGAGAESLFINASEIVQELSKPDMECIYVDDTKIKYINNRYEKVNAKLYDYQCDIKLKVADENFRGHRRVLTAASDYFAAMFSHDMKEKEEREIELKEISPAGFTAMMDYFYHGYLTVDEKNVANILEAARFFHVEWILDVCCDYMTRHLSLTDYNLTMQLSDVYSLGDLRWEIFKYFGNNLPVLLEKEGFLKTLSGDLLLQYLMEFLYTEVSEYFLVQVIANWVKEDEEKHQEMLLPLLRQIRFHTMELEELEELPDMVMEIPEIKEEVEDAKNSCLNVQAQCLQNGSKYLARGSEPCVLLTNFNDEMENNVVIYKDPENDDANLFIEQLGSSGLTCEYSTMSQTTLGNFLFAAGGFEEGFKSSATMFRYDPRFREWTQYASMSMGRNSFAFCSSENRLFVVGGVVHSEDDHGKENILSSVEMYNPEENSWSSLPDLPHGSFDQAAATWQNTVYVSGGISASNQDPMPLAFTYSLAEGADQWTKLAPMQWQRQGHSLTAHEGKLYALGGYTCREQGTSGFKNCINNEVFDTETKQWTALASAPEECGHLFRNVGLINCKIYFLCNDDNNVYLSSYNIQTNEFDLGVLVGTGAQKVAVLQVAYPRDS